MELTGEQIIGVVVFLTSGVIALWRLREKDSTTLRELSREVGELSGYKDGILDISDKVIREVRSLKGKED